MNFFEWSQYGFKMGWLNKISGHGKLTAFTEPVLEEWCLAHDEGGLCCGDHTNVYVVQQ